MERLLPIGQSPQRLGEEVSGIASDEGSYNKFYKISNKWTCLIYDVGIFPLVIITGEKSLENARVKPIHEINSDRRHSAFEKIEVQSVSNTFGNWTREKYK